LQAKKFIPLVAFVVLAGLLFRGLSIDPTELPAARLGQLFPEFSQPELSTGRAISVEALALRPALINVWATWCYSCRVEHPYLIALAQQGVPIYGLNYKDDSAKAREWLSQLGDPYQLNIADVEGSVGLDLGVYGAPETYVLDADGVITHRHVGVLNEEVFQRDFSPWFSLAASSSEALGGGTVE
jgi:cytochrome c biogenesis protein CcmG/thiol:disulfide interchange protein DsbE